MLTRIRGAVTPFLRHLGVFLWKLGISPDMLTLSGLILSFVAPVFAFFKIIPAVLILMILSLVCDALDGAVAKASGTTTPRGALLDSFSDRVEELMFVLSLGLMRVERWAGITTTSWVAEFIKRSGFEVTLLSNPRSSDEVSVKITPK
jgi:phosphatidylglycerophosphate synthase